MDRNKFNNNILAYHYRSKYPIDEMQEFYPVIDTERLGWALLACVFVLGFV